MDNNTYVHILINTLTKKNNLLDGLVKITLLQEEYIAATHLDMDQFNQTLTEKESLIEQLSQLDDGFEKVYAHVKDELSTNKLKYQNEILQLKELIKDVTEKSVKLQTAEIRNRVKLDAYFSNRKKEIKSFKMSSQTASSYYKNMANQHQGQAYFLDKKK